MKETTLQANPKRDSGVLLTILRTTSNILSIIFRTSVKTINKVITAIWIGFSIFANSMARFSQHPPRKQE